MSLDRDNLRAMAARARARISDNSLVSEEESNLKIAAELNNLSGQDRKRLREKIRLFHHYQEGIDKRRLMSELRGGGDPQPPGDKMLADAFIDLGQEEDRHRKKYQKRLERLRREMRAEEDAMLYRFRNRLEKIEGWNDPDRVIQRIIEKSEKAEIATSKEKIIQA